MINMNKISHTIILLIVINQVLSKNQNLNPSIDINEINNYKYQIDIDKLVKSSNQNNQNLNQILIKSVHGQAYQCELPDILDSLIDQEEEDEEATIGMNDFITIKRSNDFNFTLINEKIVSYLDGLKKMNICVYKNMGWWTYEFCFGSHANQYHKHRMFLF